MVFGLRRQQVTSRESDERDLRVVSPLRKTLLLLIVFGIDEILGELILGSSYALELRRQPRTPSELTLSGKNPFGLKRKILCVP